MGFRSQSAQSRHSMCGLPDLEGACRAEAILTAKSGEVFQAANLGGDPNDGYARGQVFPTPLSEGELNKEIGRVHERYVFDSPVASPQGCAGKLSMGVGGINACVISRPWP